MVQLLEDAFEDDNEHFTAINLGEFVNDSVSPMSVEVPLEVARKFSQHGKITVVSYLYYNVEELFPNGLAGEEKELTT